MATHDYVIDNQSAPSFRADLNSALQAIVTQNSSATAPTTTYANMIWYDTANNQLKKRNEANSAWITLGTINEGTGTFTPSGERTLATQAQAEAGTDNTTVMTPLRTEQHMLANVVGWGQTWQNVSGSRTLGSSYQNTTGRPIVVAIGGYGPTVGAGGVFIQVSPDGSTWVNVAWYSDAAVQTATVVVPDMWYYRTQNITALSGGGGWSELR